MGQIWRGKKSFKLSGHLDFVRKESADESVKGKIYKWGTKKESQRLLS